MKSARSGFSILELIIVVAIIALFTGGSLATYNNFNEEKKLQAETNKFVETLDSAKKMIITGDKSNVSNNNCDVVDYRVKITSFLAYELLAGVCDSDPFDSACSGVSTDCSLPSEELITSYDLPSTFAFNPSASTISFKPLGGGAIVNPNQPILIENTSISKCYKVFIENSGNVYQEKNDACS